MGAIGLVDTVQWYEARAKELADWYETASAERVHSWLKTLLPSAPATILDVGAGSGRDAAWLAGEGYEVVAVEPSAAMRETGQSRHGDRPIQWIADSLPALERTFKAGLSFDVILLSAVWMHVAPTERARAFRKLVTLLRPGGLLAITLRSGPADAERGLHEVSADEIKVLARDHGAFVEREGSTEDHLGRYEIQWTHLGIRLPDDGTGALPLLRHIILQDEKSSTYKLGLLRTLCRIADGAGGFARPADDDHVAVPMGLVALTWIRLYKPLLAEKMPQSPSNLGYDRLGFAKEAFRKLAMSHHDLRVGMRFIGDAGTALHQALKDVVRTIDRMPATHITYPNDSRPIFRVQSTVRAARARSGVRLDEPYLASFGNMLVPVHLWVAIQRFSSWIEPAMIAEWKRVIVAYAERQERLIDDVRLSSAMTWSDPTRDVGVARERAVRLLATGNLYCVWSGRQLSQSNLDIDHCFPWAVWPCDDLWNLMPTHRTVNQREKRDKLPADLLLRRAQDRILDWWDSAYREQTGHALAERFALEASVSLPGIQPEDSDLDNYYSALNMQRLRLKQNQQVPEWTGVSYL